MPNLSTDVPLVPANANPWVIADILGDHYDVPVELLDRFADSVAKKVVGTLLGIVSEELDEYQGSWLYR